MHTTERVRKCNYVTPLLQDGALPLQLVLQHASDGFEQRPQNICSLICSSKSVRKALLQHCPGLVPVGLTGSSAECLWLSQYGLLAKELHVTLPSQADQQQNEMAVAAALHKAAKAAAGGALRVQAYISATATPAARAVLSQLSSSSLRDVQLSFPKPLGQQGSSNLAFALQKLQNLTSLALKGAAVTPLLPAVRSLQQLTELELEVEAGSLGQLPAVLPAQLRSLTMSVQTAPGSSSSQQLRPQPLQLAHLTGLEELYSNDSDTLQRLVLQQQDQLPAGLLRVKLGSCPCQPLLQLRSLQEMDLQDSTLTSWDLFRVSTTLTSLSSVALRYSAKGAAAAAAPRWHALAVDCLEITAAEAIAPVVCTQLAAIGSSLKALKLHADTHNAAPRLEHQQQQQQQQQQVTAAQLADALQQLKVLEVLDLHGNLVDWTASSSSSSAQQQAAMSPEAAAATKERTKLANMRSFVDAIAALPHLYGLALSTMPLGTAALGLAQTARHQLGGLRLEACALTDVEVNYILLHQTSLWTLGITDEPEVTDSIMPVIGHGLQQLRELSLQGCSQITGEGVYCMQGLQQLTRLYAEETDVEEEDALWLQRQMHGRLQVVN